MTTLCRLALILALTAGLGAGTARAAGCAAAQPWSHEHADAESETITTDIKGKRNTRIEICRTAEPSGDKLVVEVSFAGAHQARPLPVGDCTDKFAQWAVVRTKGTKTDAGPAKAVGTYAICKE